MPRFAEDNIGKQDGRARPAIADDDEGAGNGTYLPWLSRAWRHMLVGLTGAPR